MKSMLVAAALLAAVGGASSAFAAPPATPAPAQSHAAATPKSAATSTQMHKVKGTIQSIKGDQMMLRNGKSFTLGSAVNSASLKAGERVTVNYRFENSKRVATQVTRAT